MTIGRAALLSQSPEESGDFDMPDDEDLSKNEKGKGKKKKNTEATVVGKGKEKKLQSAPLEKNTEAAVVKKKGTKRLAAPITLLPSKRRARDAKMTVQDDAADPVSVPTPRRTNPTNIIGEVVSSVCPMVAMRPGQLEHCIAHSSENSFPSLEKDERIALTKAIVDAVRTLARVHSDLIREGLLATELYIALTFAEHSAIEGPEAQSRSRKFDIILSSKTRETFFQRLFTRMINWRTDNLGKGKAAGNDEANGLFKAYKEATEGREPPFSIDDSNKCGSRFLAQCAAELSDLVGGQVFKFTLELKKRVSLSTKADMSYAS